jgi:hypothetical protein
MTSAGAFATKLSLSSLLMMRSESFPSRSVSFCRRVPDFLGDERHDRVQQAQQGFQHPHQRAARAGLGGGGGVARSAPAWKAPVPVAVLVPEEFIDACAPGRSGTRPWLGHLPARCAASARYPAVGQAEVVLLAQRGLLRRTSWLFTVHQHEARGVPDLVAEVAVAFDAVQVELDVAAGGGERRKGEAQRVGAEGGMPSGNCLRVPSRSSAPAAAASGRWCAWPPGSRVDAVDEVERVETLPLDFDIFWPFSSRTRPCDVHLLNGITSAGFMNFRVIMIMRATQKKMMSKPVTSTSVGWKVFSASVCSASRAWRRSTAPRRTRCRARLRPGAARSPAGRLCLARTAASLWPT